MTQQSKRGPNDTPPSMSNDTPAERGTSSGDPGKDRAGMSNGGQLGERTGGAGQQGRQGGRAGADGSDMSRRSNERLRGDEDNLTD